MHDKATQTVRRALWVFGVALYLTGLTMWSSGLIQVEALVVAGGLYFTGMGIFQ